MLTYLMVVNVVFLVVRQKYKLNSFRLKKGNSCSLSVDVVSPVDRIVDVRILTLEIRAGDGVGIIHGKDNIKWCNTVSAYHSKKKKQNIDELKDSVMCMD